MKRTNKERWDDAAACVAADLAEKWRGTPFELDFGRQQDVVVLVRAELQKEYGRGVKTGRGPVPVKALPELQRTCQRCGRRGYEKKQPADWGRYKGWLQCSQCMAKTSNE